MVSRSRIVVLAAGTTCAAVAGCVGGGRPGTAASEPLFAPDEVRIHRVFTKVMDWTGDGRTDGIEALVELHDAFGDPTKGAGVFTFELYGFKPGQPDPRGPRLSNPWQTSVVTAEEQRARWSKTGRAYAFRLAADKLSETSPYVLSVSFAPANGGPRLFDRITLGSLAPRTTHTDGLRNDGTGETPGTPPSTTDQQLPTGAVAPTQ